VEDNPDMRTYIRELLVQSYEIVEATNGQEGLDKAAEIIPDIIISDVMMPEMDGFQFCEKIKTDERTSHIPVILLTAKSSGESKIEGLETGADDYLIKPFDSTELIIRVKNLIEQRRKLRERFGREITLEPKNIAITSADGRFLQKMMDVIEENIEATDFGVEELSDKVGMSRSQLFRKVKALTDQSPFEFIRTVKLKRATVLLENHTGNISEIAYQVGFNNPAYFAECFRKLFGVSPKEFVSQSKE
jgi:YesN/AraC family two-component response regulator